MKINVVVSLPKWSSQPMHASWKDKRSILVAATSLVILRLYLMTRAISNGYDSRLEEKVSSTDFVGEYHHLVLPFAEQD